MNSDVRAAETGGLGKLQVTQKERPVSAAGTSYIHARRREAASSSGRIVAVKIRPSTVDSGHRYTNTSHRRSGTGNARDFHQCHRPPTEPPSGTE